MPPSKKKPATLAPAPSTATLAARVSRQDLERLVVESVDSGAVPRKQLLALLPESKQGAVETSMAPVGAGVARTGTGKFDDIDDELLIPFILATLDCKTRFVCAQAVCKAWRSLRGAQELWRDIDVSYALKPRGYGLMDGQSLLRLVAWLRHPERVTSLSVAAGESIAPDAIKKSLTAMPSLTSLALSGKKITNAVLTHAAKLPAAKRIVHLCLTGITGSVHATEASKLLLALPGSLAKLSVPAHLANECVLHELSSHLRRERSGGMPLLTHLDIGASFGGTCTWSAFRKLGDQFPELEELSIASLADCHYSDRCARSISDALESGHGICVGAFPRLRNLRIDALAGFTCHMRSAELEAAFEALLPQCPALEHLRVNHGAMWTGGSQPRAWQELPRAAHCFNVLPPSLKTLSLENMLLAPEAFETCSLPLLKHVRLTKCGPQADEVVASLVASCPKLDASEVVVVGGARLR